MGRERCHIKRPSPTRREDSALCGAPVGCVYIILGRDEQITETVFPICTTCAARHIDERDAATQKAQSANPN